MCPNKYRTQQERDHHTWTRRFAGKHTDLENRRQPCYSWGITPRVKGAQHNTLTSDMDRVSNRASDALSSSRVVKRVNPSATGRPSCICVVVVVVVVVCVWGEGVGKGAAPRTIQQPRLVR